jgi:hypothetical protein
MMRTDDGLSDVGALSGAVTSQGLSSEITRVYMAWMIYGRSVKAWIIRAG